jgi:hypothetical protein
VRLRRVTFREEGITHYLTRLSSRGVVVRPEVWSIVRRYTRLIRYGVAQIALHHAARSKPLYEVVESGAWRNVLKDLICMRLGEACCVGHYLGYLPTRGTCVGAEVWPVARRHARLERTSARIAHDEAPARQSTDVAVEGRAWRYILKHLACDRF